MNRNYLLFILLVLAIIILACGDVERGRRVRTLVAPTAEAEITPEIEGLIKVGIHLVGVEIEPGIYVGQAGEELLESCYWARLSDLTGSNRAILANGNATGKYYIEVLASDTALETKCELMSLEALSGQE